MPIASWSQFGAFGGASLSVFVKRLTSANTMSKRLCIVFAALLAAVPAALPWALLSPTESEPIVNGRPLSRWLDYYVSQTSEAQRERADQVLDKVGTNAVPVLLRMVRRTDSPFKRTVMDFARRQHIIPIRSVPLSGGTKRPISRSSNWALGPAPRTLQSAPLAGKDTRYNDAQPVLCDPQAPASVLPDTAGDGVRFGFAGAWVPGNCG